MTRKRDIERYIIEHIDPEEDLLQQLDRETHLNVFGGQMISGHIQGHLLAMLSQMIMPKRILELGTFTGYSAICLARGLQPGGKLITIERNDELALISNRYFRLAGLQDAIIPLTGRALEVIPTLDETFDLVFIDADKREYSACYHLIFDKVRPGGYILADNTLWGGKVITSPPDNDEQTRGIVAFNSLIRADTRVEKIILPFRDGLTIIRKR